MCLINRVPRKGNLDLDLDFIRLALLLLKTQFLSCFSFSLKYVLKNICESVRARAYKKKIFKKTSVQKQFFSLFKKKKTVRKNFNIFSIKKLHITCGHYRHSLLTVTITVYVCMVTTLIEICIYS